ncbi:MAG: hypothetical protein MJ092_08565 [Lachnospiraceae bacterium]|nr:hypothetical protein [Lachnospiraceae bacterium]
MKVKYYNIAFYCDRPFIEFPFKKILQLIDEIGLFFNQTYNYMQYLVRDNEKDYEWEGEHSDKNLEKVISLFEKDIVSNNSINWNRGCTIVKQYLDGIHLEYPQFEVSIDYPMKESGFLLIVIEMNDKILMESLSLEQYSQLHSIILDAGICINSSGVHYQRGDVNASMTLMGVQYGLISPTDWQIIEHASDFYEDWKNKIIYPLFMNSIQKSALTADLAGKIKRLAGFGNFIEGRDYLIFKVFSSLRHYELSRILPSVKRMRLKNTLRKGGALSKDSNWILYLFDR